jgi:hypothetical protein
MYTSKSVKDMTVAQLKDVIKDNGWHVGSARLKRDFRKIIVDSSYSEEQAKGLASMANLSS